MSSTKPKAGFTLVEVLVGTAVFLIVAISMYNAYVALIRLANQSQSRILAVELADEQFEIVRNMPYVNVGLTDGIPIGVLPRTQTLSRGGFIFTVTLVIRNENLSTSTVQASNKLVEVDVDCASCQDFEPVHLTGQVSPANLASAASGGALLIQVDSAGVPLQGATVVLQSTATSSITNTDVTNKDGILEIIGVPQGYQVYHITATKDGYSTDETSPDITVNDGDLAQVNLSIDPLSILNVVSVSPTCSAVPNFDFHLTGAKLIGATPKYSHDLSTGQTGSVTLGSMDPDTYTLTSIDGAYDANGITPFSPFSLESGTTQNVQLVVVPKDSNSLMVAVEDNNTKLPLSDATVRLYGGTYDKTYITGQGYFDQSAWSGGAGSQNFTPATASMYSNDNGGVDTQTASSSGGILLHWNGIDPYNVNSTGVLESSTFDTGTTSNFYSLSWDPVGQPLLAGTDPVKFQFATTPSTSPNGPWSYLGPDGTAGSYYTVPGQQISSANNNAEYARYMLYMRTDTATVTPSVNDVHFTYTSGCTPPGQVIFQNVPADTYTLTISKSGYATFSEPVTTVSGWQSKTVELGL